MARRLWVRRRPAAEHGEFLWLMSLSDLMMLLFILFVMLFSIAYTKMKESDFQRIVSAIRNQKNEPTAMDVAKQKLSEWVDNAKLDDRVEIKRTKDAVLLEVKDKVLFASGQFEILDEGREIVRSLASVLEGIPEPLQIGIEGHTDDATLYSKVMKDNWDLSARRAMEVMRALHLSGRTLGRTVIMAYGEARPLAPNRDANGNAIPANQSRNRRVTFRIF